jgi:hypothetical protein
MKPDAEKRLPPHGGYLRALLDGFNLDDAARKLGVGRRTLERYLAPHADSCPYPLQYAIEQLAKGRTRR